MKKRIIIETNRVVLESNGKTENNNILLLHWYWAYILQEIFNRIEQNKKNLYLQESLQEYSFSINNSDLEENIIIPAELEPILQNLIDILNNKKNNKILVFDTEIIISDLDMSSAFDNLYDDFLTDLLDDVIDSEIELTITKAFGNFFGEEIYKRLVLNGNKIIEGVEKEEKKKKEYLVYNTKELLLSSDKKTAIFKLESEIIPYIELFIEGNIDKNRRSEYLYFPFWKKGDDIELSICESETGYYIEGKHLDSGIVSRINL